MAISIAVFALLTALASLALSAWQQREVREISKLAAYAETWSMAMERHAVSDLSFAARTLLTQVLGELHIAQFLCSHSDDPELQAKGEYLELAVEGQSRHSADWKLSHQAQEDELNRIDAQLASSKLTSEELMALAEKITSVKRTTQQQLNNIWATASECLEE